MWSLAHDEGLESHEITLVWSLHLLREGFLGSSGDLL